MANVLNCKYSLEGCKVRNREFESQRYFFINISFFCWGGGGGGVEKVNLLPLGTSDMTIKYIVILLEKIAGLAGKAARCSELYYYYTLVIFKTRNFLF